MTREQKAKVARYEAFVARRIAQLRTEQGIAALELSYDIEQSRNYVNNIENRVSLPKMSPFFAICACLDVPVNVFFTDEVEWTPAMQKMMDIYGSLTEESQTALLKTAEQMPKKEK